jgi:hypothetical protein
LNQRVGAPFLQSLLLLSTRPISSSLSLAFHTPSPFFLWWWPAKVCEGLRVGTAGWCAGRTPLLLSLCPCKHSSIAARHSPKRILLSVFNLHFLSSTELPFPNTPSAIIKLHRRIDPSDNLPSFRTWLFVHSLFDNHHHHFRTRYTVY